MTSRRSFLKNSAKASAAFLGLETYMSLALDGCIEPDFEHPLMINKYGQLKYDGKGMINLPEGFKHKVIARAGHKMSDGYVHPDKPDAMATFEAEDGKVLLVRNHELMPSDQGAFGDYHRTRKRMNESLFYDAGRGGYTCPGGTTTLLYNEQTQKVEMSYLSLAGTLRNCAGGKTPWGTWISCEEIVVDPNEKLAKSHGFNFEVKMSMQPMINEPIPLLEMGRFNHEAVCVDPRTSIVYQTEDRADGIIYRFIPNVREQLHQGGRLEALCIIDQPSVDLRNWDNIAIQPKQKLQVKWIALDDVLSPEDDLRIRGFEAGAARFARGEGMWFGDNELFFSCTNGGALRNGQIFRYTPSRFEGTPSENEKPGSLELLIESDSSDLLENCDNLTVAPWGDLIVCEDNMTPRIVGVTPTGKIYHIAQNIGFRSEFAGVTFSPSGKTLFVNVQHAGLTFAITGPW